MYRSRKTSHFRYFLPYEYRVFGYIGAFLLVFIILPAVCYFPIIKPNIEKKTETVSKIEQGDVDVVFGDISEFVTHETAYAMAQEYDGKTVRFTGYVTGFRKPFDHEIYDDGIIKINSESNLNDNLTLAYCGVEDITETDLAQLFAEGDKVVIVGEVYNSDYGVICLRYCKIERYNG